MTTYRGGEDFTGETFPGGASGDTTTWVYDGDPQDPDGVDNGTGLLVAKLDAAGKGASYSYGTGGRLKTRTWARGGTTTYSHDPNTGELLTVDYSDPGTPDIGYTYDTLGRQATVTDAMGVRTFSYDPATLQLVSESIDAADDAGDVVLTRKYETGAENNGVRGRASGLYLGDDGAEYNVTYGYSGVGRFEKVHFNVGSGPEEVIDQATYSYVPGSNLLAGMTTSSGQATSYQYEPARDLKTRVKNVFNDGNGANTVSQYDYRYDELGRRTDVVTSGQAFGGAGNEELSLWAYNDRNELTGSTRHAGTNPDTPGAEAADEKRSYLYDPIGNRQTATQWEEDSSSLVNIAYTPNSLNQYAAIDEGSGPVSPTYDDDGNMTADGEGKTLTYNGENRLVAFDNGAGTTAGYEYDYIGRRVKKTVGGATITYVWDGWNLVREIADDGVGGVSTKHNVWGLDLSQSMQGAGGIGGLIAVVQDGGTAKLFAYDGNGNVGQVVAASAGSTVASYEYDPFGNVTTPVVGEAASNPWRFSTKAVDAESGYSYYGQRFRGTERWTRRDPVGERGGVNLYGFLGNRPIGSVDPTGLALYAFDGTGNNLYDISKQPTHVAALYWMYQADREYIHGVGTMDWFNLLGNLMGTGTDSRVSEMFARLKRNYDAGDEEIDIIGFSRGAASARELANRVNDWKPCAKIRFMGLFDSVPQIGLPDALNSNPGVRTDIPDNVEFVAHAVARHEFRNLFPLTSVAQAYGGTSFDNVRGARPAEYGPASYREIQGERFHERPFNGAHSDIGGGYSAEEGGTNLQALRWIFNQGRSRGVPWQWNQSMLDSYGYRQATRAHDSRYETDGSSTTRVIYSGNLQP